jgi:hypothetical protein
VFLIRWYRISSGTTEIINAKENLIEVKIMAYFVDELVQNPEFATRNQSLDSLSL